MLILRAELSPGHTVDVRIHAQSISAIGVLQAQAGERVIDAAGGALLPGLCDHHLHLAALAAALDSLRCGPPQVRDAAGLAQALRLARARGGAIRGVGYHESVAGDLDRAWLDRHVPDVPVRIQHRSGQLWILNSAALDGLRPAPDQPVPADGRLFGGDHLLRTRVDAAPPALDRVSSLLAARGVTAVTDMGARNDDATVAWLHTEQARGALHQRVLAAGTPGMHFPASAGAVSAGPTKIHLREAELPSFETTLGIIRASHARGRPVAVHCVTRTELVYTLAALEEARVLAGDRIEHASIAPPELVERIAALGLIVVTQPNFIAERGDAYLTDVDGDDQPWLYRARAFLDAGIALAGGTDAPFGEPDPWRAMRAAVTRRTPGGARIGAGEVLSPEQALALFTSPPEAPGRPARIAAGLRADLCLLRAPWQQARASLDADLIRATIAAGELIHERVDQPPG
ncbi:MAG: amidohydrolase family protein [Gammaproteobacteria bacterium]